MKKISLNELKIALSEYAEDAAQGEIVEVTKYNRPYIRLVGAMNEAMTVGARFGQGELRAVLKKSVPLSKILRTIEDDRDGR